MLLQETSNLQETLAKIESLQQSYTNNQADRDFLMLKAAEECSELSAELIQKVLHPTHSGMEDIEDEFADVLARLLLLSTLLDNNRITERVKFKINKSYDKRFK
jgi:NTP pyrophosphatase (non-canonical NTP hydrolase)